MARLSLCPCGTPFDAAKTYDGRVRGSGQPRRFCSQRCARRVGAAERRHERKMAVLRAKNLRDEANGQQVLFGRDAA